MRTFAILLLCLLARVWAAAELQTVTGVVLVPTEWSDGDSFRVKFPDGMEHTLRLYGADCFEWHLSDASDARRLRAQRRYFGISGHGGDPAKSIELAKSLGEAAGKTVRELLAQPFAVHTAFADGRGDERYKRVYAFVSTADGKDLATELVSRGLARAYGVYRGGPGGISHHEYREQLKDAELLAARNGRGAWAHTDWSLIGEERKTQRSEEAEEAIALGQEEFQGVLDPNRASRDELLKLPGVGEVTALAIIEARPFASVDDLRRVSGIGPVTLERLRPHLRLDP
jgi:competence protein ComEA